MSKFQEYMETADLYKRMSPEDVREIQKHKAEIAHLKRSGDDSVIQDEIRYEYGRIRQIEDKYRSDEEKSKRKEAKKVASNKAFEKRLVKSKAKSNEGVDKYNALSDKEKAIEAMIGIKNGRHYSAKENNAVIDEILQAFDIKERPYTFKSKLSLVDKSNMRHVSADPKDAEDEEDVIIAKVPKKLLEIMKKHDRYTFF